MAKENQAGNFQKQNVNRTQQKMDLLQKHTNAQLFIQNSKTGEVLFRAIKIIDACDSNIRDEWGFGIKDEQMKEWNQNIQELIALAEKVKKMGIELVSESKDMRDIEVIALKKEITEFLSKKRKN